MKNILLATTALVMTAGFASAEVKFSGKAEGGVYRTAKTDVAAAKFGVKTTGSTSSGATIGAWAHDATTGLLEYTAATGTAAAADAASVELARQNLEVKKAALVILAATVATKKAALYLTTTTSADNASTGAIYDYNTALNAYAVGQSVVAEAAAALATETGTAAVKAVAAGDIVAYSGYDFDVSLSGASDNGITFAAGFDMGAGSLADTTDDLALELQGAVVGAPTVSASMNGYTVAFKSDGIDDVYDDSQNGDVSVAGTIGTVTFKVVHDLDADVAASASKLAAASGTITTHTYKPKAFTDAVAAVYNTTSYTLGTTVGGIGLALTGTDKNDEGLSGMKAKATYAMDALTFGIETNNRGDSTKMLNATKISVAYAGEGVSVSASSNDDKDWDLSATLSAGANSATFNTDEESAWNAQVASDLGGGASVFGYVDNTELFMAGVRFKF